MAAETCIIGRTFLAWVAQETAPERTLAARMRDRIVPSSCYNFLYSFETNPSPKNSGRTDMARGQSHGLGFGNGSIIDYGGGIIEYRQTGNRPDQADCGGLVWTRTFS